MSFHSSSGIDRFGLATNRSWQNWINIIFSNLQKPYLQIHSDSPTDCWIPFFLTLSSVLPCWKNPIVHQNIDCWRTEIKFVDWNSSQTKLYLQEVVYLGRQLVDHITVLLRPQVLLWLGNHEFPVSGPSRSELQQEVRSLLIAGHASEAILRCLI